MGHLEALLFGRAAPGAELAGTATVRPGRAEGPLLGGTLSLLAHLCGTPWQPRLAGAILFLEDVSEKPYQLDRYLTQLRLAGALDGLAGVALGQFTDGAEPGQSAAETMRSLVSGLGVPAIEGLPAGHEPLNLAFPLGPRATLVAPGPGDGQGPRLVLGAGT
jgi:muramoyltetrapeptide carboxypeptidase